MTANCGPSRDTAVRSGRRSTSSAGDLEAAAKWTRKAIEERQPAVMFFLSVHGNALRSDARWRELAKMMKLG